MSINLLYPISLTYLRIRHIVYRRVAIDVDVAVAFIEEVCGQLILNNFRSSYEGLTMPRTWIIRALLRGTSHKPNGSMPFVLVPALSAFLKALSGNADPGESLLFRYFWPGSQRQSRLLPGSWRMAERICHPSFDYHAAVPRYGSLYENFASST